MAIHDFTFTLHDFMEKCIWYLFYKGVRRLGFWEGPLGFWEGPSAAVPAEMHPGPSISHYFCDAALVLIVVFARTGRGLKWFTFGFSPNIPTAPVR